MTDILADLNPAQREAVTTVHGPVLVLAGPGSGKTRVLTQRVAYLIRECDVQPYRVMAVTFTNKAAREMRARIERLLGGQLRGLTIGTFHATCARILRREALHAGINSGYVIYDGDDQLRALRQVLKDLNLDEKRYRPQAMRAFISRAKCDLLTPRAVEPKTHPEEVARRVYERYQALLEANDALDFGDLLLRTVLLFEKESGVLEKYQSRYLFLMVDEFQDTNTAQYRLVKMLAGERRNLFVVADEDQCVVAGTRILTGEGLKPVESLRPGDQITAAAGHGSIAHGRIDACPSRQYSGPVVVVTTSRGHRLAATPEHCVFARFPPRGHYRYVYLMYSRRLGYRIGRTCSVRTSGDKTYPGFMERLRQERGDAIWLLRACQDCAEAAYFEALYSAQYGLPTVCFHAGGRRLAMTDERIARLYAHLDTVSAAKRLAVDLGLSLDHPHHVPRATIRGGHVRKNVSFTMFSSRATKTGGNRWHKGNDPWHLHELSVCSSDSHFRQQVESVLRTKPHKQHYWAARRSHGDYDAMNVMLTDLSIAVPDAQIRKRARLTDQKYGFMPIGNLLPGAVVPVLEAEGQVVEDEVTSVTTDYYEGPVYDVSVPIYRNYVAGGIVVHNSIYRFRGADYRNIQRFRKDFPEHKLLLLERNYRSTQTILDAANAIIAVSSWRTPKRLHTDKGAGPLLTVFEAYNEDEEASYVVNEIARLTAQGRTTLGECAVMYRTNAQSRALEDAFIFGNMPYKLVGATRFYARREIRDALAYLRLIHNPHDSVSLGRIINVPRRGIGARTTATLAQWANEMGVSQHEALLMLREEDGKKGKEGNEEAGGRAASAIPFGTRARKQLLVFLESLEGWREARADLTVAQLLDQVLEETAYEGWIRDGTEQGEDRWANLMELRAVAADYDPLPQETALTTFLEEVALVSDVDDLPETADAPTLLTLHSAKGLEFDVVFIVGMEEGILPHSRSFDDPEQMEEERRLCYVGITRARERLYLLHAFRRSRYGADDLNAPSRFLVDIPRRLVQGKRKSQGQAVPRRAATWRPALKVSVAPSPAPPSEPQFAVGQRVRHPLFGEGTVIESKVTNDDEEVKVAFPGKGIKTLLASFAKLQKLSD